MKKILLTLIMSALVLTSCVKTTSLPPIIDLPSKTDPQAIAPPYEFKLDELPEIGEFSGKQQRFYKEYTPYFIPSAEYGTVIPYVGKTKSYVTGNDEWREEVQYNSYGLCTPDGKIVMDANFDIDYIYGQTSHDGFSYYNINYAAENDGYWGELGRTALIPQSGAWCIEYSDGYINYVGDGIISVMYPKTSDDSEAYADFYDYNGKKLSTVRGYDSIGMYKCGMMCATSWSDTNLSYFVDINGSIKLGPYKSAQDFGVNGLATVTDMSGDRYLINTEGQRITSDKYSEISINIWDAKTAEEIFYTAVYAENPKKHDILDHKGNVVSTVNSENRYINTFSTENGIALYKEEDKIFRASDNTAVYNAEYDIYPNDYAYTEDLLYYRNPDNGDTVMCDSMGNTVAYFDDFSHISDISPDRRYIVYSSGGYDSYYDEELQQWMSENNYFLHLYDTGKREDVFSYEGSGHGTFPNDGRYCAFSVYYEVSPMSGYERWHIYDMQTGQFIIEDAQYFNTVTADGKSYYNVCKSNISTLYDQSFNIIMKTYAD